MSEYVTQAQYEQEKYSMNTHFEALVDRIIKLENNSATKDKIIKVLWAKVKAHEQAAEQAQA